MLPKNFCNVLHQKIGGSGQQQRLFLPFLLNGSITTLTALDFLGFGLPAGSPSLGELLAQGKANLHSPWLGLSGFFTLLLLLTLLIFVGEAVRDAFDPRRSATGLDTP